MDFPCVWQDEAGWVCFSADNYPWELGVFIAIQDTEEPESVALRVFLKDGYDAREFDPSKVENLRKMPTGQLRTAAIAYLSKEVVPKEEAAIRVGQPAKPEGSRSWGDSHYRYVMRTFNWARSRGRKGGARKAIADLWNVSVGQVDVWLRDARKRGFTRESVPPFTFTDAGCGTPGCDCAERGMWCVIPD